MDSLSQCLKYEANRSEDVGIDLHARCQRQVYRRDNAHKHQKAIHFAKNILCTVVFKHDTIDLG